MPRPASDDTHFRVMRLIEAQPELSQRQLAHELNISLGAINYCLKALIARGLVKMENFSSSNNKLRYVYVLTPSGMAHKARLTGQFLQRKLVEYEALEAEIAALKAEMNEAQ